MKKPYYVTLCPVCKAKNESRGVKYLSGPEGSETVGKAGTCVSCKRQTLVHTYELDMRW